MNGVRCEWKEGVKVKNCSKGAGGRWGGARVRVVSKRMWERERSWRPVKLHNKKWRIHEWKDGWMEGGADGWMESEAELGLTFPSEECVCVESGQTGSWRRSKSCSRSWLDYSTHRRLIDKEGRGDGRRWWCVCVWGGQSFLRWSINTTILHRDNLLSLSLSLTNLVSHGHTNNTM